MFDSYPGRRPCCAALRFSCSHLHVPTVAQGFMCATETTWLSVNAQTRSTRPFVRLAREGNRRSEMQGCSMSDGLEDTLVYSVAEACAIARIGRTSLYKAIRNDELRAIKRGRRTLILPADLRRWLESSPAMRPRPNSGDTVRDRSPEPPVISPAASQETP
jgi:excisionase family DNA binding protein